MAIIKHEHITNGEYCGNCALMTKDCYSTICNKFDVYDLEVINRGENYKIKRCEQCLNEFGKK